MRLTPDGQFLLTVSEDGSLAQFAIENKRERTTREQTVAPAEEILVAKVDLEQKMALIADLQSKVDDLQSHNELQLQLRAMTYSEKYRDVTQKFLNEMEIDKTRYQALEDEKQAMQRHHALQIAAHNAGQAQSLQELEKQFNAKLRSETKRYEELDRRISDLKQQWQLQSEITQSRYEQELKELQEHFAQQQLEAKQSRSLLELNLEQVKLDKDEMEKLVEQDADMEIEEQKAIFDKKLTDERKTTLTLQEQNAVLWRQFGTKLDEIRENETKLTQNHREVAFYAPILFSFFFLVIIIIFIYIYFKSIS